MSVEQTVVAIIAEHAMMDPADIKLSDAPADLGIDSMGLVECIFGIEEAFDITVPFNANAPEDNGFDISSVAAIVKAVEDLVSEKA